MITRKEIIRILKKELHQREESDVDIIVKFERPIGLRFVELLDYIEKLLGKKVNFLDSKTSWYIPYAVMMAALVSMKIKAYKTMEVQR